MSEESLESDALELPESERLAFIDVQCGTDSELKRQALTLLKIASLIRENAGAMEAEQSEATHRNARDGIVWTNAVRDRSSLVSGMVFDERFQLIQKIGEGGMGEIWVADQLSPVKRRVAIKFIRDDFVSSQSLLRFELERQTLAMLEHPNIAKMLDGGVEQLQDDNGAFGRSHPYFVMEGIQGVSLTKYCEDAKLPLMDRIRVFIEICMAVQHAHQKGIIHRDLKPSNILIAMIDGRPVPKIIVFGIAKVNGMRCLDDFLRTQAGTFIGTLEYMSPEQADPNNLDIDTRRDISSLGVLQHMDLLHGLSVLPDRIQFIVFFAVAPIHPSTARSLLLRSIARPVLAPLRCVPVP